MATKSLTRWRGGGVAAALLMALLLALVTSQNAQPARDEDKTAALPSDLAKIPSDGLLLFSIRVADLWAKFVAPAREKEFVEATSRQLEKLWGVPPVQVERWTLVFLYPPKSRPEPLMLLRTLKPYDRDKLRAAGKNVTEEKYKGQTLYTGAENWGVYLLDDRSWIQSSPAALRALIDRPVAKTEGDLAGAPRLAAGKHALVGGLNVKSLNEALDKELPGQLEPFRSLLKALAGTLTVDVDTEARGAMSLGFPNEKDARAALKPAQTGLNLTLAALDQGVAEMGKQADMAEIVKILKQVLATLKSAKIEQQGKMLRTSATLQFDEAAVTFALRNAVLKVREAAARSQSQNNLHQIAIAMQNYHTAYGRFPPQATYDKSGKPMLSWRVTILPLLDQEDLYKQFHIHEPWDSEHNKKLLAKMPKEYASPQDEKTVKEHTTHYLGFVGKGTFFEGKRGIRFADIPDGTSQTIMIVEASKAVPWTKPEDLPYDAAKPLPKLGIASVRDFSAAMCDGSVRLFNQSTSERTLRGAITRDGGEVLGPDF
ncbi:MAG: DUF1559 family PulG-like putative transporter [Gemmataceae bacterium]